MPAGSSGKSIPQHRHHLTNSQNEWPQTKAISRIGSSAGDGIGCAGAPDVAALPGICGRQLTPSFFCRLDDEVVYWNTSRLSG